MKNEAEQTSVVCHWEENFGGVYETECAKMFVIVDGTPTENEMRFCCYCGRTVVVAPYREADDREGEMTP